MRINSPFHSRMYGGYTKEQEAFYLEHLGALEGQVIFDPMAGQGFAISKLVWGGASVHLGDIDPAPILLATLRDPELLQIADSVFKTTLKKLQSLKNFQDNEENSMEYVDDWVAPSIAKQLQVYMDIFNLRSLSSPFTEDGLFWHTSKQSLFAAALPVLAARELTCFRHSDNRTWLKQGGLQRETNIYQPLIRALHTWLEYAAETTLKHESSTVASGRLSASCINVETGDWNIPNSLTAIVTSPPYANRLDYSRMWSPELEILCSMYDTTALKVKADQIGSTVVKGKVTSDSVRERLPENVKESLEEIKNDRTGKASETYYHPFFLNYAVGLTNSLDSMVDVLPLKGKLMVFVRDTVRKDILFPTGDLVEKVILSNPSMKLIQRKLHVVRNHVGLIRKSSLKPGLHGLAQREWWLVFQKENK